MQRRPPAEGRSLHPPLLYKMEITECTKIIHDRISKFDPDNAIKIIGYLLLYCPPEELMQYALASDKQIYSIASEVKAILSSSPKPNFPSEMPTDHPPRHMPLPISRSFSLPSSFRVPAWQPPLTSDISHPYNDFLGMVKIQPNLASLEEQLHPFKPLSPDFSINRNFSDALLDGGGGLGSWGSLRSPHGMAGYPIKPCHYFFSGFCRHGTSCKFSHGQGMADSLSPMCNMGMSDPLNHDRDFYPGSLEKLDVEISELLKTRNGMPVSIANLPMLYLEKYGKALQSEGYLTESQRHGKAGCSLTKLLARLQNIRLIDRPHGQHSVVLAEDAPRYMEYHNERSDAGAVLACSHQIYLTFPAESTFTDEDVMHYFMQFGPVRDVRIPRQEKRMFGFVSFHYPDTVKSILGMSQPHNICGSRVLVKPYKEKTRVYDRKYPLNGFEVDPDISAVPRSYENSRLLNMHLMAEREHAFEIERMRLMKMQLAAEHPTPQQFSTFGIEDLKLSEECYGSFPVVENNGSSDDKPKMTGNDYSDQESGAIELPDSPFASPRLGNPDI